MIFSLELRQLFCFGRVSRQTRFSLNRISSPLENYLSLTPMMIYGINLVINVKSRHRDCFRSMPSEGGGA